MAAVALAWESQSTRRVGCSEAARQAAKLTAVVVLPTPPFWFAQAMILAKCFATRNLTNVWCTCKLFHVKRPPGRQFIRIRPACSNSVSRFTFRFEPNVGVPTFDRLNFGELLFYVKQNGQRIAICPFGPTRLAKSLFHVKPVDSL